MSYEIRLNQEHKLVIVVHHQMFRHGIGSKVLPEMMNVLAFKRWNNILVDFRDLPLEDLQVFEQFIVSQNLHNTLPSKIKMGVLVSDENTPDGSSIATDTRMDLRLFSNEGAAMNWFIQY